MTQENNFKPGEWVVFEVNRCIGDLKHCKTDFGIEIWYYKFIVFQIKI